MIGNKFCKGLRGDCLSAAIGIRRVQFAWDPSMPLITAVG